MDEKSRPDLSDKDKAKKKRYKHEKKEKDQEKEKGQKVMDEEKVRKRTMGHSIAELTPDDAEERKQLIDRVACLERVIDKLQQDLVIKNRRIQEQELKLNLLTQPAGREAEGTATSAQDMAEAGTSGSNSSSVVYGCNEKYVQSLEESYLTLLCQVQEMEDFLADYGMVWVGGSAKEGEGSSTCVDDDNQDQQKLQNAHSGKNREETRVSDPHYKIDFDLILGNIEDLNEVAGEGEASLQYTTSGARLTRQPPVPIIFFANGLVMYEGGPFRPYFHPAAQQCVADLTDGFFPSELQWRYPDGVPFAVTDRRDEVFHGRGGAFSGAGKVLGRAPSTHSQLGHMEMKEGYLRGPTLETLVSSDSAPQIVSSVNETFSPSSSTQTSSGISTKSTTTNQHPSLRATLPEKAQTGVVDTPRVVVIETPEASKALQETEAGKGRASPMPQQLNSCTCTLRIRSETGSHVYVLVMSSTDTIGHLRRYLNSHGSRQGERTDYVLRSAHPLRVFTDDSATLESCGLVPNAVMYLRAKCGQDVRHEQR